MISWIIQTHMGQRMCWVTSRRPSSQPGFASRVREVPRLKRMLLPSFHQVSAATRPPGIIQRPLPPNTAPPAALTTLPSSPTLSPRPQHLQVRHSAPPTHTPAFAGVSLSPSRSPWQAGLLACPTRHLPIPDVGERNCKEKIKKGSREDSVFPVWEMSVAKAGIRSLWMSESNTHEVTEIDTRKHPKEMSPFKLIYTAQPPQPRAPSAAPSPF